MMTTTPPTSGPLKTKRPCARRTKTLSLPKSFNTTAKTAMALINENSVVRLDHLRDFRLLGAWLLEIRLTIRSRWQV